MSITYPEAPTSVNSKKVGGTAVMNSGSALFPTGATGVYERAAKARKSRGTPLAWVAAPVAVVLIGGAIYLSATHQPATRQPTPVASRTVTTQSGAPAPILKVQPSAPLTQTTRRTHIQIPVKTIEPAPRTNSIHKVTRAATVSNTGSATAPAAVTLAPSVTAPTPAPATPTPGTFAFTPAAPATSTVSSTPDTVTPAPTAAAPAPSSGAQPSPQP